VLGCVWIVQVVESLPRNSGRDRVPVFIFRQKVPRAVEPVPRPGDVGKQTVLNVFGDIVDGYFILDRLKVTSQPNADKHQRVGLEVLR